MTNVKQETTHGAFSVFHRVAKIRRCVAPPTPFGCCRVSTGSTGRCALGSCLDL